MEAGKIPRWTGSVARFQAPGRRSDKKKELPQFSAVVPSVSLNCLCVVNNARASLCRLRLLIPLEQDGYQNSDQQEALIEQEGYNGDASDACQSGSD